VKFWLALGTVLLTSHLHAIAWNDLCGYPLGALGRVSRLTLSGMSTRDGGLTTNSDYLASVSRGLNGVFAPWLESRGSMGKLNFQDMLRAQHRAMVGRNSYSGVGFDRLLEVGEIGEFRKSPESRHVVFGEDLGMFNADLKSAGIEVSLGAEKRELKLDGVAESFPTRIMIGRRIDHAQKELTKYPERFFPDAKGIPFFLERMETQMAKLRAFPLFDAHANDAFNRAKKKEFLDLLCNYYQVGINAQLFKRINNSLLMTQVNYFLMLRGFKAVAHGQLDNAAFFLDSPDFRKFFHWHVDRHQYDINRI
jgi:hypothetical protein